MRRVFFAAVFMLAGVSVVAAQPARRIVGVASVIDGDTLEIHGEHIRLNGFDAPERGRYCAGRVSAKQITSTALDNYIAGRTVRCVIVGHDTRNDRPVGVCSVGGVEIGAWMVAEGWARDWPQYSCGHYADGERRSRAARRGLWGMQCPALWPEDRDYIRPCPQSTRDANRFGPTP